MMLNDLNAIDWSGLKHAYGPATDVPQQIMALQSPDRAVREKAMWSLYGNIFHQGTRYQAAPYAVPFLLELLTIPTTPDKHLIIDLLVSLALGYDDLYVLDGLNPTELRSTATRLEAEISEVARAVCEKYGNGPQFAVDCYDAVLTALPTIHDLAREGNSDITTSAIYAMAWFPEEASASHAVLIDLLAKSSSKYTIANIILALGLLSRQSPENVDLSVLHEYLSSDDLICRVAAAISLASDPLRADLARILINGIQEKDKMQATAEQIPFSYGKLVGLACLALAKFGASSKDEIVPVLCEALKSANTSSSIEITHALLGLGMRRLTEPLIDTPPSELSAVEVMALRAVAEHGGWKLGTMVFANYSELTRNYGLPGRQEELLAYLAGQ